MLQYGRLEIPEYLSSTWTNSALKKSNELGVVGKLKTEEINVESELSKDINVISPSSIIPFEKTSKGGMNLSYWTCTHLYRIEYSLI